jgi:hypothetical protein
MRIILPLVALLLIVLWITARVTLAVTGFFLHLLWIIGVIMMVIWLVGLLRKK